MLSARFIMISKTKQIDDIRKLTKSLPTIRHVDPDYVYLSIENARCAKGEVYVKEGDYRYLFAVNFFSFLHCLQTLIPSLKKTSGTACIISSIGAIQPIPFDSYYTSTKAALNALCKALRYELAPEGINIIGIMPGGTKTDFTKKRKVYSPAETDGYSKQMSLAVDALAKIEQNGMTPQSVASTVFKKCHGSFTSTVYSSGILNKFIHLIIKLMPQVLLYHMGRFTFFMEEED